MDGFDVLGRKLSCKVINDQMMSGGKPAMSMMQ
jgi:hypothetical protein